MILKSYDLNIHNTWFPLVTNQDDFASSLDFQHLCLYNPLNKATILFQFQVYPQKMLVPFFTLAFTQNLRKYNSIHKPKHACRYKHQI